VAVAAPAPPAAPSGTGYAFPALTGRVVDAAGLLPADVQRQLAGRLASVEAASKHSFVVVTVTSLGGHNIDDYGLALGNAWGIGRKCINDGVLLVVAPTERKVRIEVGRGLEKTLTNAEAAAIVQNDILPRFRDSHFADGIVAGSEAIIREITP
jgi:uncharacterized membrane protein YgcG